MADRIYDIKGKRIFVAGHKGMVGSAMLRRLAAEDCEVITVDRETVDLTRQADVEAWMAAQKPEVVVIAAAKVGGIYANNSQPAPFLYDNLMIEANLVDSAHRVGVEKLLFLGSSCIYPRLAPQPMPEDSLLTGPLEPTNQWYAVAKIAGIKLCQAYRRQHGADFISAMPTNLYGPGDNFDPLHSHVVAALLRRIYEAREEGAEEVVLWGTGSPLREFMHVDDLADALVFLLEHYSEDEHINVGTGEEVSIRQLADLIAEVAGWQGRFEHDTTKPDGTPRKLIDCSRLLGMGWQPRYGLREGLRHAFQWLSEEQARGVRGKRATA